jgi:hypothetical protein
LDFVSGRDIGCLAGASTNASNGHRPMALSFMKSVARVLRIWSSIVLVSLFAASVFAETPKKSDEEIMAEMQQRLHDVQARALEASNPQERLKIQAEITTIVEDTLKQVSPKSRAMVSVGLKIIQPLQADVAAYTDSATKYFSGANGSFRSLKSREEIAQRIGGLAALENDNLKLLGRINAIEGDAEKMLKDAGVGAADREGFMEGMRNGAGKRMGALRAIRTLDARFYAQWRAVLQLLDEQWGKWHATSGQPIAWDDAEAKTKFDEIMAQVKTIGDRQRVAQRAALAP